MKALVLYASRFGQTRAIAERIASRLRERGHDVDLCNATEEPPAPDGYDLVVLGSRVEVGKHAAVLRLYMRTHRDVLVRRATAVFSVSMAAARADAGADPNGYLGTLFEDVGWEPTKQVAFAGALCYRKYSWFLRFIMKRISKSAGHTTDTSRNHEFTDWQKVLAFADQITELFPGEQVAQRSL